MGVYFLFTKSKSKTSNFKLTTPVWFPVSNLDMSKYLENKPRKTLPQNTTSRSGYSNGKETEFMGKSHSREFDYEDSQEVRPYVYDLFAVCNHKGQNMANGHYTGIHFCSIFNS